MKAKRGANEPCHCGSGRKYKKCHRELDRQPSRGPFKLGSGLQFTLPENIEVSHLALEASALPQALLFYARRAARDAQEPHAGAQQGLTALALVATAGEAIVNRLLEPLMGESWTDFERSKTEDKWLKLSELLKLQPPLAPGAKPLQAFLNTVRVRNELVHFKHGKNVIEHEGEPVTVPFGPTGYGIDVEEIAKQPLKKVRGGRLEAAIDPTRAAHYLKSLTDLVGYVVDKYPEDHFGVVEVLKATLTQDLDEAYGDERGKLLAALRRAIAFVERVVPKTPEPTTVVHEAAAGALVRLPDQLRAIITLAERHLYLEADTVARSVAEAAITILWIGTDEDRARQFRDDGLRHTRAWFEAMERQGAAIQEPTKEKLRAFLASDTGTRMPNLEQRARAVGPNVSEIYDFPYRRTSAGVHNEYRLYALVLEGQGGREVRLTLHDAVAATMFLLSGIGTALGRKDTQKIVDDLQHVLVETVEARNE